MQCKNRVDMGQGGGMSCGSKWGDTSILCDKCKTKIKLRGAFIDGCLSCGVTEETANCMADRDGY